MVKKLNNCCTIFSFILIKITMILSESMSLRNSEDNQTSNVDGFKWNELFVY